jgi:hypothetical protein
MNPAQKTATCRTARLSPSRQPYASASFLQRSRRHPHRLAIKCGRADPRSRWASSLAQPINRSRKILCRGHIQRQSLTRPKSQFETAAGYWRTAQLTPIADRMSRPARLALHTQQRASTEDRPDGHGGYGRKKPFAERAVLVNAWRADQARPPLVWATKPARFTSK